MVFKITDDEIYEISERIKSEVISIDRIKELTLNATTEQLATLKWEDDVILLNRVKYAELMIEALHPKYVTRLRGWIRNKRHRATAPKTRADRQTTMNISKKNIWRLDQLKHQYDFNHPGANIKRDDLIERSLQLLSESYDQKIY
jgi:hypothetical protein